MLPLFLALVFVPTDVDGRPLPAGAVGRLGSGRHSPGVWCQTIVPTADPNRVLLVSNERILLWDLAGGRAVWTSQAGEDGTSFTGFGSACPVGVVPGSGEVRLLVTVAAKDQVRQEVRAYELATGRPVRRAALTVSGPADLSADGRLAAWVAPENTLVAADPGTGREAWRHTFPPDLPVRCVAASPAVVAAAAGNTVYLRAAGGPLEEAFVGQPHTLSLSADGSTLAGIGNVGGPNDNQLFVWSRAERRMLWTRDVPSGWWFNRVTFAPDGRTLLAADRDADGRLCTIWLTVADGRPVGQPVPAGPPVAHLSDGRLVSAVNGVVNVWDAGTGRRVGPDPEPVPVGWGGRVRFAGGRLVADPGAGGGRLGWDLATGRPVERMTPAAAWRAGLAAPAWHDGPWSGGTPVAYSPDGRRRAAVPPRKSAPGVPLPPTTEVRLTDPATGAETGRLTVPVHELSWLRFTPDGRHLLAGKSMDRYFLYDLSAGGPAREFGQFRNGPNGSTGSDPMHWFDPAGRRVAVVTRNDANATGGAGQYELTVYDLPGLTVAARFAGTGYLLSVVWSADGRRLAAAGSGLLVAELPAGRRTTVALPAGGSAAFIHTVTAMSANGRTVAVYEYPTGTRLIEAATGGVRLTLPGVYGSAGFGPGDRLLAAVDADNTVLLYPLAAAPADDGKPADDWAGLGSADAAAAFRAVRRLAADPGRGVPLLRAKLPPAAVPHPLHVVAQVGRLNAPGYADRRAAAAELRRLGAAARPALEAARKSSSAEVRSAADRLLAELALARPTADDVRAVRAVEAAEWMGTPAADRLLADWAAGGPHARLTAEAKAAAERRTASGGR